MKRYMNRHIIIIIALSLLFMTSCKQMVIRIDSVPENTPIGQQIYVTGNFNNWDPGEEIYIMEMDSDSNYYITLPPAFGSVEYKFTRGDWTTVEKGICGEELDNRLSVLALTDTISASIESWNDLDPVNCPKLTIKIDNLPTNTPIDDIIAIASSFNSWDPDNASIFEVNSYGELCVTIDRPPGINKIEYKMTRGDLSTSESDEFGNELPNRILEFGKKDTVTISIEGWADLPDNKPNRVIFIIDKLPENTPPYDKIFLLSNLNSWHPGDMNYQFQVNKNGQLFFPVPRKKDILDYKITRGSWQTTEVDKNGREIDNRTTNLMDADTIYLNIDRWKDMGKPGDDEITVVLYKIPESTPENAKFYISGTFNDWNPGRLRYRFHLNENGDYYVNLPRKDGDFEMIVTRGWWESAQIDKYGSDIIIKKYHYQNLDTVFLKVDNWKDQPISKPHNITLVIDRLPVNTPDSDNIYLAPDFNGWNPFDNKLIFDKLSDGRPVITVPTQGKNMEYKITRGGWSTAEVNRDGEEIRNRNLYFGFADTVYIKVKKWRDFDGRY